MTELETQLATSLRTILQGFDDGVFVRDVSQDDDASWAMRLVPFVFALQSGTNAMALYDEVAP